MNVHHDIYDLILERSRQNRKSDSEGGHKRFHVSVSFEVNTKIRQISDLIAPC